MKSLIILSFFIFYSANAQLLNLRPNKKTTKSTNSNPKKETKKIEKATDVNPQEIESKFTKDPVLDGHSTDQVQADQIINYANEKQQNLNDNHVLKINNCKKLLTLEEIESCKRKILNLKN